MVKFRAKTWKTAEKGSVAIIIPYDIIKSYERKGINIIGQELEFELLENSVKKGSGNRDSKNIW